MDQTLSRRWRLVLGKFANKNLSKAILSEPEQQQDQVLESLYKKQLERRGLKASGTLDDTQLQVVNWLDKSDRLFPRRVRDKIQAHAIHEFGLKQILKDKDTLSRLKPDMGLLKQLLAIRSELDTDLLLEVRKIIQAVVDDLLKQLTPRFSQKLQGRLNRHQNSPQPIMANLDWHKTIRQNLKYYDLESQTLMVQRVYFSSRNQKFIPWRVILCIDQSGSMMDSVIYSAVIAGILSGLPTVELKLILFDTNVVDMSDQADDPVKVLMTSQMCGGTHIKKAWQYCTQLAEQPAKTVVATVSDFEEGGSPTALVNQAKTMISSGIKMLGITAMTADSIPFYDSNTTARLSNEGMDIASLSPDAFADWLAKAMEL